MIGETVKYCIECKWIHSEKFKPGLNVSSTQAMPDDELLHLCNHPTRRHLVTAKPVAQCGYERGNNDQTACGIAGKLWEAKNEA